MEKEEIDLGVGCGLINKFMSSELTTIIFSKNRACQLDLLLREISYPCIIQYTCDPDFEEGYTKLIKMYPMHVFIKETTFKETLVSILNNANKYILFLVDDDVFIEKFTEDCPEFNEFKNNDDILCLNLRMAKKYIRHGKPILKNNTWEWKKYYGTRTNLGRILRNWGYPMAASGYVFRLEDIIESIITSDMSIPNRLEGALFKNIPNRSLMKCFDNPKTINNLANKVQNEIRNTNLGVSIKKLEEGFLNGKRLSLSHIKNKAKYATYCFLMVEYEWE